jgi:hypothetical protein
MTKFGKRVAGEDPREINFEDFTATRLQVELKTNKSGREYFLGQGMVNGVKDIYIEMRHVCKLQEKNAESPIIINGDGESPKLGEDCTINPEAMIARTNGKLVYASKEESETPEQKEIREMKAKLAAAEAK